MAALQQLMWNHLMPEELNTPGLKQASSSRDFGSKSRGTKHSSSTTWMTTVPPPAPAHIGCFSSSHLIVNMERQRHGDKQNFGPLLPLLRSAHLDNLAKQHAMLLAEQGTLHHSVESLPELQAKLQANNVGENVQRGESIREMHQIAMQAIDYRSTDPPHDDANIRNDDDDDDDDARRQSRIMADNILSPKFTEIGVGTAVSSSDGMLYMVQLFRGGYWV